MDAELSTIFPTFFSLQLYVSSPQPSCGQYGNFDIEEPFLHLKKKISTNNVLSSAVLDCSNLEIFEIIKSGEVCALINDPINDFNPALIADYGEIYRHVVNEHQNFILE